MTVAAAILANLDVRALLLKTACHHCAHPFHAHQRDGGACYGSIDCPCGTFVDEYLPSTAAILRVNAARRAELGAVPCANCGRPYMAHTGTGHPFADVDEVLS